MPIRVCLAGATGWAGSALAHAIAQSRDLSLVAAVSRKSAGRRLGEVLKNSSLNDVVVSATSQAALKTGCDVFFEYTRPEVAKSNVAAAIASGAHVVIGTSGLSDEDLEELGRAALQRGVGVLAAGNLSMTTVILTKCALLAAQHLAQWEIVDLASADKPDAPSGTARELAWKLAQVHRPDAPVPVDQTQGMPESRGATLHGMQVHSIRLPGHVLGAQVHFGALDEKLSIHYEAGSSPEPYVAGGLAAIRGVGTFVGLKRGLDSLIDL
ncbi:MAG: 4-hydroxy-tetrahydrodipicolinate reductase [Chloroflexi bacterium]|nr:4-hydroxy-tetrahydrodipicolinate reductase [Chloroflexota bacterium]